MGSQARSLDSRREPSFTEDMIRNAIIAAVFVALTGCIPLTHERLVTMSSDKQDARAKLFEPVSNMAAIYIVRDTSDFPHYLLRVTLDGAPVGDTLPGTYFRVLVTPGAHEIGTEGTDHPPITLETEAEGIYFLRLVPYQNILTVEGRLTELDPQAGKAAVSEAQLATLLGYAKRGSDGS